MSLQAASNVVDTGELQGQPHLEDGTVYRQNRPT